MPVGEEEVDALMDVPPPPPPPPDVDAVCVGAMLQDELLQVEKCALVLRVLPHLWTVLASVM